ncbi:hypothetical protein HYC85_009584 [Camellia sinensis]|uniref:SWI/SNF complex subunit SWI3D n=1 Tax=Camellia sinensis TaxID=4442 RepID=A0A7J7HFE3_CAMSI|nr:hypothetical protein HYC85_009584 [Camellia sinensis]
MEEMRNDTGKQPAASSAAAAAAAGGAPTKIPDAAPAVEPPSSRRRGGGQKRKGSGGGGNASTPSSSKRQAREKPSAISQTPIHNGPCTRARQSPSTTATTASGPSAAAVVKKEAEAEGVAAAEVPPGFGEEVKAAEETSVMEEDLEALEAKIEAEYQVIRLRDVNAHVVPIPAGWFSWTKVHPLEERTLPSFFNGKSKSRTPEIYMEIRNWIMRKFHENPNTQIELKVLSELSVGELDARQEVMEFLDHWGLINYHPFPESDPAMANANGGDGLPKINSLVEKLYRFETEQLCAPEVSRTNVITPAVPSGLFPESAVAEELVRQEGPSVEYHCNSCSADCSRTRYHCQKQVLLYRRIRIVSYSYLVSADYDLCTECFNNGKLDSGLSPTDFILMEPAEAAGVSGGKWTDQETLLLLEALELYNENWNEIAEHVATKTKAQCILHFVQMPIEDTFMDCDDEKDASVKENADTAMADNDSSAPKETPEIPESRTGTEENQPQSSPMEIPKPEDASELKADQKADENFALKALKEAFEAVGSFPMAGGQFSFAEAGNPVMALAAFLVRVVEPNKATALVRSSLKSISGNSSSMQLAARHSFLLEDPPGDKKKSADSERAVAETIERDAQKNEKQNEENGKEEKSNSVLDGGDLPNDHKSEKDKVSAREEKELPISHDDRCTEQSNKSDNPDLPKDLEIGDVKESDDLTPKADIRTSSGKEPGDQTREETLISLNESDNPDIPKDMAAKSAKESDDSTPKEEIPSGSAKEPGEEETKDSNNEKQDTKKTKDYHNIDKMKRAAVTAISAAAVKAKLLADQEEDQIRQLATLLIDKQLHKLETKLAFFTEMESVVMRVREQMERSKQRLYQERAQIIATRLGLPASSSGRPMQQQSLPINRVAMGYANSATKPPMSMTSQRPPASRSMMTLAPPTSKAFVSTTAAGNPVKPTNQDKFSSVVTK